MCTRRCFHGYSLVASQSIATKPKAPVRTGVFSFAQLAAGARGARPCLGYRPGARRNAAPIVGGCHAASNRVWGQCHALVMQVAFGV